MFAGEYCDRNLCATPNLLGRPVAAASGLGVLANDLADAIPVYQLYQLSKLETKTQLSKERSGSSCHPRTWGVVAVPEQHNFQGKEVGSAANLVPEEW